MPKPQEANTARDEHVIELQGALEDALDSLHLARRKIKDVAPALREIAGTAGLPATTYAPVRQFLNYADKIGV